VPHLPSQPHLTSRTYVSYTLGPYLTSLQSFTHVTPFTSWLSNNIAPWPPHAHLHMGASCTNTHTRAGHQLLGMRCRVRVCRVPSWHFATIVGLEKTCVYMKATRIWQSFVSYKQPGERHKDPFDLIPTSNILFFSYFSKVPSWKIRVRKEVPSPYARLKICKGTRPEKIRHKRGTQGSLG
jgi:hypothetical protein